MFNIKTLNKISTIGLSQFDQTKYTYADEIDNPDAILVRSASMHDMQMPESLLAIARAGAGTNNIPCDECAKQGIVVFNTPGANANAVKELVLAGLFMSSRKVLAGIEWAKTLKGQGDEVGKLVEKGKSAFAGPEILGKTLGVLGLGAIGAMVADSAQKLGMNVIGYDPFTKLEDTHTFKQVETLEEVWAECDYISIHIPLNDKTKHTVNAESIAKMKDGVRILNYARGGLVDSDALIKALEDGKVAAYVVDFPDDKVLGVDGVIAIPHLGASTPESEENCAYMAAKQVIAYLENGSIINSVNMPNVKLGAINGVRACVIHKNVPNTIAQISTCYSNEGININKQINVSRGDYAYTVIDADTINDNVVAALSAMSETIKVRVIK